MDNGHIAYTVHPSVCQMVIVSNLKHYVITSYIESMTLSFVFASDSTDTHIEYKLLHYMYCVYVCSVYAMLREKIADEKKDIINSPLSWNNDEITCFFNI